MLDTRETAAAYLAGLIDGEGCVYFNIRNGSRAVTVVNTEPTILHACQRAYDTLGIRYTVSTLNYKSRAKCKRGWRIRVHSRASFLTIYQELPLQSKPKKVKLAQILRAYSRKPVGRFPPRTMVARNVLKNQKCAAAYLAALIDGEGDVSDSRLCITNTDDDIIAAAIACYSKLGIGPHSLYNVGTHPTGNYEVKRLVVFQQQARRRIYHRVPIQCVYKKDELERLVTSTKVA